MAFISQSEINNVRANASIVDIISSYIPLNQKGKNYFGVCPFHEDHSPSMSVSSEKQIYKCFSCGATGNVFTFIENYLNVSFFEAVQMVADKVGITIKGDYKQNKIEKYQTEYEIFDFVCKFYQNNLNSEVGRDAIKYLDERGLNEETRKEFQLGLSLKENILYQLLHKKEYSDKMLLDLGLINDFNNHPVEVFQSRIMFPIHNLDGKVVGFTARCYKEEIKPKYVNTKETYIFKKGNILFNYHKAKDNIRLKREVVVVEGNMDAIRLYASGIKNVIALMGTSLTKDQVDVIKKLKAKVILMLDNDSAGASATYANGNILEENNLNVAVVRLSGAKDPDEYVLTFGIDKMEEAIKNNLPFIDFKLNYLKQNKNLDSAKDLAEYIKEVINGLKYNNDPILKEVTLQKLANDYNISYAVLKSQLDESGNTENKNFNIEAKSKINIPKSGYEKTAEEILYYMMNDYSYIKMYQTELGVFPDKKYRSVANEIIYFYEMNKKINVADFITYAASLPLKDIIMDIISNGNVNEFSEKSMLDLLNNIKKRIKENEIEKLKEEIKNEYDINKKIALTEKMVEIKKGSVEFENN